MAAHSPSIRILWHILTLLIIAKEGLAQDQAISIQPESSIERFVGESALMTCSVTDKTGALVWTRTLDGVNTVISNERDIVFADAGGRYSITGDDVSGSFNLNIENLIVEDTGFYVCLVTGTPALESNPANLTVTPIPIQTFTAEPADTQGTTGATATLICTIKDKEGQVEWLKDGSSISNETEITDGSLATRYSIVGNQGNGEYNLQIVNVETSDAGSYQCRVSAAGESSEITSGAAALTVQEAGLLQNLLVLPSDGTATVGTTTKLVCHVTQKKGILVWLHNGVQISRDRLILDDDSRFAVVGSDEDGVFNLRISNIETEDAGQYFCSLLPGGGDPAVSSGPATLTVLPPEEPDADSPVCTLTPSGELSEGDVVTIRCESTGGSPQPMLEWSNDLDPEAYPGNYTQETSSAENTLTLTLESALNGVIFTCRSTHPSYSTPKECQLPALTFELVATINVTVDNTQLVIEEDKNGEINCYANGDPPVLSYAWIYNGAEIDLADGRFVIETTNSKDRSTLTIVSASLSMDDSTVQCEARNRIDSRRASIVLQIKEDNLVQYILAALGLIAAFIFVAVVVAFLIWFFYRKNKRERTIHPVDTEANGAPKTMPNQNYFITANHVEKETGAIPNGKLPTGEEGTKKKHKKHHKKDKDKDRKHKKHKKDKSKVLDHDSTRTPNPLSTRDGEGDVLPTITGYKRPGATSRDPGLYPTYPPNYTPMQPLDGASPVPHYQPGYVPVDQPDSARSTGRRSSKDQSGNKMPRMDTKVSLSPGEYQARDEYERRLRELQGLRQELAPVETEKKKKKHKKHKKGKSKEKDST